MDNISFLHQGLGIISLILVYVFYTNQNAILVITSGSLMVLGLLCCLIMILKNDDITKTIKIISTIGLITLMAEITRIMLTVNS